MKAAFSKAELESDIASRFGDVFKLHEKTTLETLSTGVDEIDALTGGLPRGAISEFYGPASSGRTSLMYAMLAYATAHEETCALVDTNDVFAPTTATAAGIDFKRQVGIPLLYKGELISEHRPDLIVADRIVVEIKSIARFDAIHTAVMLTYLRVARLQVGLLLNFNTPYLRHGVKRVML